MENNFEGQTINLNNMGANPVYANAGLVAPVSVDANAFANQPAVAHMTSNVESAPAQTEFSGATTTVVETPVENPTVPTLRDTFEVPTLLLKSLMDVATKVGNYSPHHPQSQVICLSLNSNGITVRASNGQEYLELYEKNYKYVDSLMVTVDIRLFSGVIKALDCANVVLSLDDNGVLIVKSETGQYKFAQKIDASTQQPVYIDLSFMPRYDEMSPVNYDSLHNVLEQTKPVRDLVKLDGTMKGVYFSNITVSTDSTIMLIQNNDTGVQKGGFFMGSSYCDLLNNLSFNAGTTKVGYTTDGEGVVRLVTISDGHTTLCGPVETETEIPLETCIGFWNESFDKKITVDTRRFSGLLARMLPFINQDNNEGTIFLNINTEYIEAITVNGAARETLMAGNQSMYTVQQLSLPVKKISSLISKIKSSTFDITINPDMVQDCICLSYDNNKCIVALVEDEA